MLERLLTWVANVWLFLVVIVTGFDFVGIVQRSSTTSSAVWACVAELLNYRLYVTVVIVASPAIAMLWWRERRRSGLAAEK